MEIVKISLRLTDNDVTGNASIDQIIQDLQKKVAEGLGEIPRRITGELEITGDYDNMMEEPSHHIPKNNDQMMEEK